TEVDESGEVISYEEYHPYGTSAYRAVDSSVDVSAKRYRYTGMERDEETGLAYHSARYYVPWLGRWTAADPIAVEDGTNRFAYVHARPVVLLDATGTFGAPPDPVEERRQNPDDWDASLRKDAEPLSDPPPGKEAKDAPSRKVKTKAKDEARENVGDDAAGNEPSANEVSGAHGPLTADDLSFLPRVHSDSPNPDGNGIDEGQKKNGNLLDKVAQFVGIFSSGETGSDDGVSGGIPGGQGPKENASQGAQAAYVGLVALGAILGSLIYAGRQAIQRTRQVVSEIRR